MMMLKRLFQFFRRPHADPTPSSLPPPMVDAEEFARLIGSGRVEDLRTLALRLSMQPKAHA